MSPPWFLWQAAIWGLDGLQVTPESLYLTAAGVPNPSFLLFHNVLWHLNLLWCVKTLPISGLSCHLIALLGQRKLCVIRSNH